MVEEQIAEQITVMPQSQECRRMRTEVSTRVENCTGLICKCARPIPRVVRRATQDLNPLALRLGAAKLRCCVSVLNYSAV